MRSDVTKRGLVLLALAGLLLGGLAQPASAAAGWSAPTLIDPTRGDLVDVSCATVSFCMAVDGGGATVSFDGSAWSTPQGVAGSGAFTGVSCPSATFCGAISYNGNVYFSDGTAWSLSTDLQPSDTHQLLDISCASATSCVVIDDGSGAYSWDGSSWSARVLVGVGASLRHVSCPSPTFCMAVGSSGFVFDGTTWGPELPIGGDFVYALSCTSSTFCMEADGNGDYATFNGTLWSARTHFVAALSNVRDLSCSGSSFCVAVADDGAAYIWNGSTWSTPSTFANYGRAQGVSCPSASFCVAVDHFGYVYSLTGASWSAGSLVDPGRGELSDVSCTSPTFCMAVDANGNAMTFDGSAWSAPVTIDPQDASGAGVLTAVSCSGPTFCAAVDGKGNALTYDGSSWSSPANLDWNSALVDVSCTSPTFCMVADSDGSAFSWDGTSWADAGHPGWFASDLDSVSCVSPTFCQAGGYFGNIFTFDGTWSEASVFPAGTAVLVACGSTTFCGAIDGALVGRVFKGAWGSYQDVALSIYGPSDVTCAPTLCMAVDGGGQAITTSGGAWSSPTSIDNGYLTGVSCVSDTFCMAVDEAGNALKFTGTATPPAATALSIIAPSKAAPGTSVVISGVLSSASRTCRVSQPVFLQKGTTTIGPKITSRSGGYRFVTRMTKQRTVQVVFEGTASCAASVSAARTIGVG